MPHHVQREIRYNFEYDKRLKACFIGAGGHAFRNVYPTFRYAPVDLVAICDLDKSRADGFARIFGAERTYTDHHEMLAAEKPDVVFIVTDYAPDGRVRATALAGDCAKAGAHAWMEKPTAASRAEVEDLIAVSRKTGRQIMTGLKKTFFPAIEKPKDIIESRVSGNTGPDGPPAGHAALKASANRPHPRCYHQLSVRPHQRAPTNGAAAPASRTTLVVSGAVGRCRRRPGGPLERVEAIGRAAIHCREWYPPHIIGQPCCSPRSGPSSPRKVPLFTSQSSATLQQQHVFTE